MLMSVAPPSRNANMRRLGYVARSLATKQYPVRGGNSRPIFSPQDTKAFRRAFVEAAFQHPFRVDRSSEGCRFWLNDTLLALICPDGRLCLTGKVTSPIQFSPTNVRNLGFLAFEQFLGRLRRRYAVLSGLPEGADDVLETDRSFFPGAYYPSRVRQFMGMAVTAMKTFCAELDPHRLRVLRANYLVGPHHAAVIEAITSPDKGQRWCQALEAYPALICMMLSYPQLFVGAGASELLRVVANGEPLVPFLAAAYRVSEATVRRWRGVTLQRCGRMDNPIGTVAFVGALPQHLLPRSREDFIAAKQLYSLLWDPMKTDARIHEDKIRAVTVGMKHPLAHYRARIAEVLAGIQDVRDSVRTALCRAGIEDSEETLLGGVSFGRLADINRRWHYAHQAATKEAALRVADAASQCWPGILPGGSMPVGEFLAVELTSPGELLQEGRALQHCVASYHDWCYAGRSRIVSLRGQDGKQRSTIELQMRNDTRTGKLKPGIAQHYGWGNGAPAKEEVQAARALLKALMPLCETPWARVESPDVLAVASYAFIQERMQKFVCDEFPEIPPPINELTPDRV